LGGYSVLTGAAWRWEIPVDLRLWTSINSLEFIACVITIWVDIIAAVIQAEDCIFSQTDNTTAAGWLRKSNFAEEDDEYTQLVTARKLASLVIDSKSCIYSQWFSGKSSSICDTLSRDFNVESIHLCNLLCANFPSQVPFGLNLHPLPNEIISWVTSLLRSRPQTELWSKEPVRSSFARGSAFKRTCTLSESLMTPTLMASTGDRDTKYSAHLDSISKKVNLVLSLPNFSSLNRSAPPWIAWHRPSSWLSEQIQDSTLMGSLLSFYNDSFGDTDLPTQEKNPRWQSLVQC
jgi:hypothetical protein